MGGKRTPLFEIYGDYNAKVINYSGWELPVQFEGITEEHLAVRQAAGLFDVSHMGEIKINGKDAERFLQYILTNDISVMNNNDVIYTFMCYENGGVVDDLLVYKHSKEDYLLVINASNIEKDYRWFNEHKSEYNVNITNISENIAEIAIQGPKAQEILQTLTAENLSEIEFFKFKDDVIVAGEKCLVSRTGYTGEDGFEIYTNNNSVIKIWRTLMDKGEAFGLKAAGLGSRDTLRFEANLPLYGQEISKEITPLEAGFGYFVKLDKNNFIGKNALIKQKTEGLKRKLVGFELLGKGIARHGYEIVDENGDKIGFVTTGYMSPSLNKTIGLALVDSKSAKLKTKIFIKVRKKLIEARIIRKKFLTKNYKK